MINNASRTDRILYVANDLFVLMVSVAALFQLTESQPVLNVARATFVIAGLFSLSLCLVFVAKARNSDTKARNRWLMSGAVNIFSAIFILFTHPISYAILVPAGMILLHGVTAYYLIATRGLSR